MNKIRGFEVIDDKFRKNKDAYINLPRRATNKSSGYDFYCPIRVVLNPNECKLIWSDVKAYMMEDEELLVFPRSGLSLKYGVVIKNTIGKIDSDYYSNESNDGNIGLTLWNTSKNPVVIEVGDRVCQGTFYKYLITDNDSPISNERTGGFGSTK